MGEAAHGLSVPVAQASRNAMADQPRQRRLMPGPCLTQIVAKHSRYSDPAKRILRSIERDRGNDLLPFRGRGRRGRDPLLLEMHRGLRIDRRHQWHDVLELVSNKPLLLSRQKATEASTEFCVPGTATLRNWRAGTCPRDRRSRPRRSARYRRGRGYRNSSD